MNGRMISRVLGLLLACMTALLLLPMLVGLAYGESARAFLITMAATGGAAFLLTRPRPETTALSARDGFAIVGLGWMELSAFGALPFVLSGDIPNYIDALFESASGFTTTGATVLEDVESMSRGCMFWRIFTNWLGGMGILVFMMAALPMNGNHSMHIMRAEVPGPAVGKLVPRARKTARILYLMYFCMTLLETVLLRLGGMDWYDSLLHAFATAGTGGFSTRAGSIGYYDSAYIDVVISVFLFLFSLNFNLYYLLLIGRVKDVLKNEELRTFVGIIVFSAVTMALNTSGLYGGFFSALRYTFFAATSVQSTAGFVTADFSLWPEYSRWLLVLLMLVGGCAGSTGGAIKVSRVIILLKAAFSDLMQMVSPRRVRLVKLDGRRVPDETVRAVYLFCSLYIITLLLTTWLLTWDGRDMVTNFTAAAACLGNIGPGPGLVGLTGSFAFFSHFSKLLLTLVMLMGRLELYPILVLFIPEFWRN